MDLFLALLDQLRYITGACLILFLLCHRALPHRTHYATRLISAYFVCVLAAALYLPINSVVRTYFPEHPTAIAPYWLCMSLLLVGFVLFCYETNPAGALFRTMMGAFVENFVTVLIRYLIVMILWPELPGTHPLLYVLIMLSIYAACYTGAFFVLGRRLATDESEMHENQRTAAWIYLFQYLAYTAILSATKFACENVITPLASMPDAAGIYRFLQVFLVANMLLISVVMSTILYYSYDRLSVRNEKQILMQMARDKESQYEFSRENIEMINRKSHDLKHQLRALEQVSDEERRQQLRETRKAIDFYDAVVKTGNDALDTILTEKSVYCANRNIRLSCTVHSEGLGKISLVDLYTLLGNAIDNAIESVDKLSDEGKKVISLSIQDRAQMLVIQIENYFDGTLELRDGLPVTSKADKGNHGYGVKSIRTIAQRHGGMMRISTEGQIFRLQVAIPIHA